MHAEVITPEPGAPGRANTLAVLGDSISFGIGDPVHGGGWRGFAPLLAEALGVDRLANVSTSGARIGDLARDQLPAALRARPDVAVVMAGMNDTMRSDFDPRRLHDHMEHVLARLTAAGVTVVTIRYHDHGQVFRLPGPLRRFLSGRIDDLNTALEAAALRHGAGVVDLDRLPGSYHPATWSVDRLHPCELGHRMLAHAFAHQFAEAGVAVPGEVSLQCSGGRRVSRLDHLLWLVAKGIPWLVSRTWDLVPYLANAAIRPRPAPETLPLPENRSTG